jgi:hypothetical protein
MAPTPPMSPRTPEGLTPDSTASGGPDPGLRDDPLTSVMPVG